ncbi:MAG: HAMP domain-containing histidine kinase [Clostridia bacterium]|nr:HAMP domain-containing histidine kinase [Clostridia bacterium]
MKKVLSDKNRIRMAFVFGVAGILLVAILLAAVLEYILVEVEAFTNFSLENSTLLWILMFSAISIIIGLALTFILQRVILKPVNTLLDGMDKLANGEFNTRIDLGSVEGITGISDKFNALARELQKIEILRSDFVNNFSHEMKTPIVSISSLISLMKNGEISKDKQMQYLNIIEEEINRLSEMTTNVLNLSKIENQGIITEKTEFNLSEQIRTCVLLLEKKWSRKKLELDVDFDEYTVVANEDMLKQVWFNLIDNAIKFAERSSLLKISICKNEGKTVVKVTNKGEPIAKEDYEKIFQKFYQGSSSSKKDGNGIGLSIVKHIVDLHEGRITAESKDGLTTFTVTL